MKTKAIYCFFLLFLILTPSCKEEGCTDFGADNFDAKAREDDGSCYYLGDAVIWYKQAVAEYLVMNGAETLYVYCDGEYMGSHFAGAYWQYVPDCGGEGTMTINPKLKSYSDTLHNVQIFDQRNIKFWDFEADLEVNQCLTFRLNV